MINKEKLNQALTLLGKILELNKAEPIHLIICGGSSLLLAGFISRSTRDIDVLGFGKTNTNGSLEVQEIIAFPEFLMQAVHRTAMDLGLDKQWLNNGPTQIIRFGLPEGFVKRLTSIQYGPLLTISFIGRYDQIHFKLMAAVDSGPGRHLDDLLILHPSEEEIGHAAQWSLTHDSSEGFRKILKEMLGTIGYGNAAKKF